MIAVLDIGKTNKKIALFDDDLRMVDARRCRIEPVEEGGLRVENLQAIESWCLDQLRDLARSHAIRAIGVTTHGATSVCVDAHGRVALPPVDYTQPVDDEVHARFFRQMGAPEDLQTETATAEVRPLINVGKALFFLKERFPDGFTRIAHVLFYPQYFVWRLTGVATADVTYAGCHTYTWDFHRDDWSGVVDGLGLRSALPARPVLPTAAAGRISAEIAAGTGLSPDTIVAAGMHDSNASLLPYLITRDRDFVLNSTGTWCVAMRPADRVEFSADELGKMVFYNRDFRGRPVKTSILLGGLEYETYHELLDRMHPNAPAPEFDPGEWSKPVAAAETFVLPSVVPGAGQFPDSLARVVEKGTVFPLEKIQSGRRVPEAFENRAAAAALVDLSIAVQSSVALRRVGLEPGMDLFVEGGFRHNTAYLKLLTALFPDNPVSVTNVEEATSLGAALCAAAALHGRDVESFGPKVNIECRQVEPWSLPGIADYRERFLDLL